MGRIKVIILFAAAAVFLCGAGSFLYAKGELLSDSLMYVEPVSAGDKIIVDGFYFDDGSAAINMNLKKYLKNIAAEIKKIKYSKIYVDGYTDNRGDNLANNRLSRARANGVRSELIKNGVPAKKIQARAYGSVKPIASNDTKAGRVQNRRIEIIIK